MATKRIIVSLALCVYVVVAVSQSSTPSISEMRWGKDYKLHVKLSNDTNYVMDVRVLHHAGNISFASEDETTTYYPVNLDEDFVSYLKSRKLEAERVEQGRPTAKEKPKTLWSALHGTLGGGYVHFINCLVYSLESQNLNLTDPIMKHPVSNWKPKPMTQTYKRTQKWEYYIPFNQAHAHKEYKRRVKEKDLADLQGVPKGFLNTFLSLKEKDYLKQKSEGKRMQVAQADVMRLLLGAKYLGVDQIEYIQNRVSASVLLYSASNLPSVIIFDDYRAAVAMTLDKSGYKIDYVVFQDQDTLTTEEYAQRFDKIEALITTINEANERVFRKRLSTYYGT